MNSIFSRIFILTLLAITFSSCDKDANDIGANIIGNDHFGFSSYTGASIIAYNQATSDIQTENLAVNQLGIYDNPVFGKTVASVGVQLNLAALDPLKDETGATQIRTVTDVLVDIPYYNHVVDATVAAGSRTYELDSIVGTKTNKIKLIVYRSGNTILNSVSGQINRYFSNTDFDTNKIGSRLNDDTNTAQNDEFVFDKSEVNTGTTAAPVYAAPSLRLKLNSNFANDIFTGGTKLKENDGIGGFKEYYNGLYFKVEQSGTSSGCLSMLDFKKGTVTIKYKYKKDNQTSEEDKSIVLNMSGNNVTVLQHTPSANYTNATSTSNPTTGDKKLWLKGGNGSVAKIDLFTQPGELDLLKSKGWLVNDANIVFTIDQTTMSGAQEPNRIMLYDVTNGTPIIDYTNDVMVSTKPNFSKKVYGGIIEKTTAGTGIQYKIRITNHIKNILSGKTANTTLGLVVCQNINNVSFGAKIGTPNYTSFEVNAFSDSQKANYFSNFIPNSSILNPLGTVLYGNNYAPTDADYAKRMKLEIWYTKP
jgi:Domain of unknown function (DUF4270)